MSVHRKGPPVARRPSLADYPDYVGSQSASMSLVRTIEDYWAKRGSLVNVKTEYAMTNGNGMLWVIRSDLVNGFPLRRV